MTSTQHTTEQAQEAASTAAEEGRHVADVATSGAKNVAGEAAAQARHLVDDTVAQVTEQMGQQARSQRDNVVSTLQTFSGDLDNMASQGGPGLATDLVRELADRARALTSALEGREPQDLLEDVRGFARRRPGVFLLGALTAGVLAGRVARGAKQASSGTAGPASTSAPIPAQEPTVGGGAATPSATGGMTGAAPPHGQPIIEPASSSTGDAGPMGSDAAGYGRREGAGAEGAL